MNVPVVQKLSSSLKQSLLVVGKGLKWSMVGPRVSLTGAANS